MSIVPAEHEVEVGAPQERDKDDITPRKRKKRRKSTSHLKFVPESLELRELIKREAERYTEKLDKSNPFNRAELEQWGRELLGQLGQPEKYLGFTAVLIGNFFWKQQFLAVPFERRLLLLPHCLKHADGCPAEYDEFGLDCETCGACSVADYKGKAERLGYKVLVAEGSPIVLKIIVSGYVDAILGVACLNVLEKAIDKVLIAGVASYAIPLHSGDCKNTSLDPTWLWEVLDQHKPIEKRQTSTYLPIMRASNHLFEQHFDRLLPRVRTAKSKALGTPIATTEEISYDWLTHGGKRFRPFITLAAYDAVTGAAGTKTDPANAHELLYPDSVSRVAMAIEAFHKASLVHDDIEDDDMYRYGRETLHRQFDVGTAINVGDYLIGVGYRLLNSCRKELDSETACDVLDRMAAAHVKLCDGQGAEMAWQNSPNLDITPLDALQIYALKTAPAFEAALHAGLRMAGSVDQYDDMIPAFSRHIGIGFQILNDLKDWQGDDDNKLLKGQDALALRPTILLALAIQAADDVQREKLQAILTGDQPDGARIEILRSVFQSCGVFEKAEALVDKSRDRAEALANDVEPDELRQLLYFLVDTVLAHETPEVRPHPDVLVPLEITRA